MITNRNRTSGAPRLRSMLCSLFFIAASIAVVGAIGSSHPIGEREHSAHFRRHVARQPTKIAPWVIEHTANGQQPEFFVVLKDQADVSGAAALGTKSEKGQYVYDALRNKSETTQRLMR